MKRTTVTAVNYDTNQAISANSVKELAEKMGTSRTNVSDVINEREGREFVRHDGGRWIIA